MKVLVTGTHFTPAVATIEELKKFKDVSIVYVGRKTTQEGDDAPSVESQAIPSLCVKFIPVIAGRLQRAFTIYTVPSILKIPLGFLQALYIVLTEKPDVILSFGGYVSVPIVFMGWLWSIPVILHEQTLVSGLANRISSLFADKIAVSFDNRFKGNKVILTGNPIRYEVVKIPPGAKLSHLPGGRNLPVVLIMGGNQGSHAINLAVEECLDKLLKVAKVYHQAGSSKYQDYERLDELGRLGKLGDRYIVKRWIGKEYGKILQMSDLVVCRAGINTLTELAVLGKPALVIPIPYLYQDEQNKNAKFFEKLNLVRILPQSELSAETLISNINLMLKNLDHLKEQAKEAKKVIIHNAAKRLALETVLLAKNPEVGS